MIVKYLTTVAGLNVSFNAKPTGKLLPGLHPLSDNTISVRSRKVSKPWDLGFKLSYVTAAETPVKFQSDQAWRNLNLAPSIFREFW